MTEKKPQVIYGTWQSIDYTVARTEEMFEKEGWTALPSDHVLRERGYGNLIYAVRQWHSGPQEFSKYLRKDHPPIDPRWMHVRYTYQQARKAVRKEGWAEFPASRAVIRGKGYRTLLRAIAVYHGGFRAFRQKFNAVMGKNPAKDQLENLLKKYVDQK